MLWHAISPSRAYVKAPHDVVRHSKLSSDAKILIVYVQGLPESRAGEALSDHAKKLGIKGRAYQKAKGQLKDAGFVHEWRRQVGGGLWVTDQLFSNAPLTDEEARRLRDAKAQVEPGDRYPAGGRASTRSVGGYQPTAEEREKNSPTHPPKRLRPKRLRTKRLRPKRLRPKCPRQNRPRQNRHRPNPSHPAPKSWRPSACCSRCGMRTRNCTWAYGRRAACPRWRRTGCGGA